MMSPKRTFSSAGRPLRRGGLASLQDAVQVWMKKSGVGAKSRQWPVFQAWIDVAGRELARHARPVRFERGELSVEVDSSSHLHELRNFTGENLRALANVRLGQPEIRRVAFRLER